MSMALGATPEATTTQTGPSRRGRRRHERRPTHAVWSQLRSRRRRPSAGHVQCLAVMDVRLGPPRFLFLEHVRIVAAAGDEAYDDGQPVNWDVLVGEVGDVWAARPTSDRRGWMLHVMVPARPAMQHLGIGDGPVFEGVWWREGLLESVGL